MTRARSLLVALLLTASAAVLHGTAPAPPALDPGPEIDAGVGKPVAVSYSADGRLLVVAGASGYGWWDAQTGVLRKRETASGVVRAEFSPSNSSFAIGGSDGRVQMVDMLGGANHDVAKHAKAVTAIAFQPGGKMGASGDAEGNVILWDPVGSALGTLKDGNSKEPILFLAFTSASSLLAVSNDMSLVMWDVNGKRPLRKSGMQSGVSGRSILPASASLDSTGNKLIVAAQLMARARQGALSGGSNVANPADMARTNVLMPYDISSGISGDPVVTGDFVSESVALSPSGCYAFFSSYYRNQPRLHVWGLVEKGDDLVRQDLPKRATVLGINRGGNAIAVATEAGRVQTFKVSGTSESDCQAYAHKPGAQGAGATSGFKIVLGSPATPLLDVPAGTKVAIMKFETNNASADLADGVTDVLSTELANSKSIVLAERAAINTVLKEMEIQRSGLTEGQFAAKIGKGLNVRKVLLGSVRRFGEDYLLTIRSVDVETQQVEGARDVTCENCKEANVLTAAKELRKLLVK